MTWHISAGTAGNHFFVSLCFSWRMYLFFASDWSNKIHSVSLSLLLNHVRHGDFGVLLKHTGHEAVAADVVNALQKKEKNPYFISINALFYFNEQTSTYNIQYTTLLAQYYIHKTKYMWIKLLCNYYYNDMLSFLFHGYLPKYLLQKLSFWTTLP